MTEGLLGIHHVTAMTDNAERNYEFFTNVLGMRLVKKTVNQDDIYTYHTFFADDVGSPGTDMTFFDFPNQVKGAPGSNSIYRTGLRVPDDAALEYYKDRFNTHGVNHGDIKDLFGKKVLEFEDADGQKFRLFSDEHNEGVEPGTPWQNGPVPVDKAIYGLGPIEIHIKYFEDFKKVLTDVYEMIPVIEEEGSVLLNVGEGGNGGQVILKADDTPSAKQGYGEVHHVSFRVKDHETIKKWEDKYNQIGMRHSGNVNRFYFEALYTRVGHILIELSTDGPGFMGDEPYETLGESLALPPFLEERREYIESQIRPFNTKREG